MVSSKNGRKLLKWGLIGEKAGELEKKLHAHSHPIATPSAIGGGSKVEGWEEENTS